MPYTPFQNALNFFATLGKKVVVVDVESTGGDLYQDRLTEIALVVIENGHISEHTWLINPQKIIPPFVEKLTGISNNMVKAQPVFARVASEILPYLKDAILIAHNVQFDYGFLRIAFLREQIYLQNHVLCSVKLSRKLYPEHKKHNLDSIIERMQINLPSRHRALPDAQAIIYFLERALKEKEQSVVQAQFNALLTPKPPPAQLATSVKQTISQMPDDFGYYVLLDKEHNILSAQACERLFRDCCTYLDRLEAQELEQIASISFHPTTGIISAHIFLALWYEKNSIALPQTSGATVVLKPNEQGMLEAKVISIINGTENQLCYGYFPNAKAAKKALTECAQSHELCRNSLGLIHPTPPLGAPCVQELCGQCIGACVGREEASSHNLRAQKALLNLPVRDWYFASTVQLIETHPISGLSQTFTFDKGRLIQEEQPPFFYAPLLPLIKKQIRNNPWLKINQ